MKIEILDSAEKDLLDGFEFYERQSKGLGSVHPEMDPFRMLPSAVSYQ